MPRAHKPYMSRTQPCIDLHMLRPQQLLLATQALYEPHTSLTRASQEPYTILKKSRGPHQDIVDELLNFHLFHFNARTYLRNGHVVWSSIESCNPQWPRTFGCLCKDDKQTETSGGVDIKQKDLGVWGHFGFQGLIM